MAETGGRTETFAAPVERIVAALLDVDSYPQWQSVMVSSDVWERDGEGRPTLAEFHVDARVRKVRYVSRCEYDLPHRITWHQVEGDLKELREVYTFTPRSDGGTDVTADIAFEIGFYVPRTMMRLVRDQSLRTWMRELRGRVGG